MRSDLHHSLLKKVTVAFCSAALAAAAIADKPQEAVVKTFTSETCPVSQRAVSTRESVVLAGLAIKFVEKALEGVVSLGVSLLNEAAKDKTIPSVAASSGYLYATDGAGNAFLNPSVRCVVFYKGIKGEWAPLKGATNTNLRLFAQSQKLKDIPDVYVEAWVEPSSDNLYFRLRPMALRYLSASSHSWATASKSAVMTLDFNDPSREQGKGTFGSVVLANWPGTTDDITVFDVTGPATSWMQLPQIGEADEGVLKMLNKEKAPSANLEKLKDDVATLKLALSTEEAPTIRKLREAACAAAARDKIDDGLCPMGYKKLVAQYSEEKQRIELQKALDQKNKVLAKAEEAAAFDKRAREAKVRDKLPLGQSVKVYDWRMTLVETEHASRFIKVLAAAASDIAPDVKEELKALTPAAKAAKAEAESAAKVQKIKSDNELDVAALTALNAAQLAEAVVADLPVTATNAERAKADTDARLAKLRANVAFRQIGRPDPYPSIF